MENDNYAPFTKRSTCRGNQLYYSFTVSQRLPILILKKKKYISSYSGICLYWHPKCYKSTMSSGIPLSLSSGSLLPPDSVTL